MMDKCCYVGNDVTIGYEGENNAREIRFWLGKWRQAWPTAVPRMVIERETDGEGGKESYIAVTEMDGDTMVWKVKSYDLEHPGYMKMWIVFVDEGEEIVGMSPPTQINVLDGPDMIDGDTPPEMTPPWMVEVIAAANRIDQTAAEIPQTIEAALQAAKDSGEFDGEDGYTPHIALERVEDGVQVTVTNEDGEDTETIYDGSKNVFIAKPGMLPAEIIAEAEKGKACFTVGLDGALYAYVGMEYVAGEGKEMLAFRRALKYENDKLSESTVYVNENGRHYTYGPSERKIVNPEKLYVKKDGKTYAYDGSARLTLEIPSADVLVARLVKTDSGYTSNVPYADIVAAKDSGKACIALNSLGNAYVYIGVKPYNEDNSVAAATFSAIERNNNGLFEYNWIQIAEDGRAHAFGLEINAANPYPLMINGKSYDGSEAVNLTIEGGTGGGSGLPEPAGPHQMLATDSDGNVSWKEQLAYETEGTVEIVPQTTIAQSTEQVVGYFYTGPLGGDVKIGKTYTVTYNGVDYVCEAWQFNASGDEDNFIYAVFLGNKSAAGEDDTGEPFAIMAGPSSATSQYGATVVISHLKTPLPDEITVKIVGEATTYKKVSFDYLPEGVGGVESGYVLPEVTLEAQEADDGMMFVVDPLKVPIAEGSQYTVAWNGVEYKCIAQMFSMDGMSALVLGDIGLVTGGTSTGEPFAIIDGSALGMGVSLIIYPLDGSTTATLSISGEMIRKIPAKYLDTAEIEQELVTLSEEMAELKDGGIGSSAVCMLGVGEPTESTDGEVGGLYMDTLTGDVYKCTGSVNGSSITVNTDEGLPNVYIKASNGSAVSVAETSSMHGKYTSSDYLNVETMKGKTVKITCCMLDIVGFAIYDSNKLFIAGVNGNDIANASSGTAIKHTENYEYTLPDNAAYIRYSVHSPYVITDAKVVYDGDVYYFKWEHIAIKIGDNEGDAFSAARGIALEGKANDPVFTLPAKSIAVVGHEWNMYFHNILDYMTNEYFIRCSFSPSIVSAKMLNDVLRFTPTADDVGIHELSLKLYRKTGDTDMWRLIKTHTVSVNVIADAVLTDKKVIFIGDSLTQNGTYPAEIQHNLSQGGIVSMGTRTRTDIDISGVSLTVAHEGRAGWASYDYTRTREGCKTDDHPFWNEDAGAFDFSYYMETQGYSGVDVVCIALGTNGVDKRDDVCAAIDVMIASIHAYNPDIQVLVSLITLPGTQDGCGVNNGMQNSELLKMQTLALNQAYLKKYQNTMTNVDVAELYFALDTENDYNTVEQPISARNPQVIVRQNGNVHPSTYGYLKIADVWYNNILYHLTN